MASYVYDSTDSYPFSSVDNGFTYTPATSTEDFGAVNVAATSQESYDTVTVRQGNDTPYGFATVNGSATYWKPKKYRYSSSTDNLYTSEDYGDIVLIERYGTIDTQSTETQDWGLLGGTATNEDLGVVTTFTVNTPDSSEDYGTLTASDGITAREDRYLIIQNESVLAMETAYTYASNEALVKFVSKEDAETTLFYFYGASSSSVLSYWFGTGTPFEIGGSANEIVKAFSSVGTSGPLRLDVTSTEVHVKSYDFENVLPFNIVDYGSLGLVSNPDIDFGFVSQPNAGGEQDYGLIVNDSEETPFGLYETNGIGLESFSKQTPAQTVPFTLSGEVVLPLAVSIKGVGSINLSGAAVEKNTEDYVGTGNIFNTSGAAEVFVANPPENIQLFQTSGTAVEKFRANPPEDFAQFTLSGGNIVKFTSQGIEDTLIFSFTGAAVEKNTEDYVASGTFSTFSGAAESVTYRYSFDSFVPFFDVDYGSLTELPTNDIDLGNVSAPNTGGETDYGFISFTNEVVPYGLWTTSGFGVDSFSKNIVDNGGTITLSGEVVLPLAVSIIGVGSVNLSGSAVEKNTEDYVGTGDLFTASGAAEVLGVNPPEDFSLFNITGAATEKNTERYIGNSIIVSTISTSSNKINTNSFVGVSISGSGTGIGTTGGFNIGNHLKFNGVGARSFSLNPLDVGSYDTISFTAIRGNDVNGGEDPDTTTESLVLQYSINGGNTYVNIGNIVTYNDTSFNSLKNISLVIPSIAKTSSTIFRILQSASSGTGFDNYGITEISLVSLPPSRIVVSGGYTNLKFTSGAGETTQLFALSGAAVEKNTEDYVGTGSASINVTSVEKNTETYVAELAKNVTDLFASYGDLTAVTESEDYGLITQSATNVDYRYLTSDYYDINGAAIEKFVAQTPENTQLFQISGAGVEKFVAQTPEDIQLFQFTGAAVEKNTEDYVASGTFSTFSGAAESVTYRYSFDSFVPFFEFDYGSVTQSSTNDIDLGSVSAPNTGGEQDYGIITFNNEVVPYGLWTTSGFAVELFSKNIVDNGGTITLSGEVVLPLAVSIIGVGSVNLTGSAVEKNTEDYVGTGNLFTASGAAEVFGANPPENTQLFSTSGNAVEKFRANPPEDFAQFTFSGAYSNLKFTTQGGETTQLFTFSGAGVEKNTEDYVGTGSTSIDVTKIEKNTESYTVAQASIHVLSDYGDLRESAGSTEDFGLITSAATEFETAGGLARDYLKLFGYAVEKLVAQTPENTQLFDTNGAAVEKFVAQTPEQTVTFTYTGNAVEKNTESYVGTGQATFDIFSEIRKTLPSFVGFGFAFTTNGSAEAFGANPPENTQLFQVSGAAVVKVNPKWNGSGTINIDITSVEKNTESYVGTGTLFEFIDSDESRTYVYDLNDAVPFLDVDYGSISAAAFIEIDYGVIAGAFSGGEVDYGTVVFTGDVLPFGSITLSGAAIESFSPQTPENTQIFVISGVAVEKNTEVYTGDVSTTIAGSAVEKNTEDYVGTGSLFTVGGHAEVFGANPSEDFALFDINGTAVEKFRANPPEDFAQFTFSGVAVEKFTTQGGEDTQLFTLSGSAVERNTESYVGTGTLFEIVDKIESRTYDYTVSQSELLSTDDYGLITDVVTSSDDYESIDTVPSQTTDYGLLDLDFINIRGTASESFGEGLYTASGTITIGGFGKVREIPRWVSKDGVITISGTGTVPLSVALIGSGNLFTSSGAAEAFGANPPENIQLFQTSGTAVEKFRANPPEDFAQFTFSGVAIESAGFNPPENTQNISVTGVAVDVTSVSEIGTGSLFTAFGAAEVFGANPPESTQLFVYSGVATEKNTESYVGTGTTEIDVTHTMRFVPNWIGSGAISIDIESTEKNTESYVGSGNAFTFIDSEERRTYDYTVEVVEVVNEYRNLIKDATTSTEDYGLISSTASEFIDNGIVERHYIEIIPTSLVRATPREIASGSLFTASGAAEVFGANPPENTQIFSYSGTATEKNTESWVGTGSQTITGEGDEDLVKSFVGSGVLVSISGSIFFIGYFPYTDYITLFTSGAASYKEVNAFNGTGTTTTSGSAVVTNTESYVGSGSLFGLNGAAESVTYRYGDFVIIGFNEFDYEFITQSPTIDIDYGSVAVPPLSGINDYGYIRFEETIVSATGLFSISGAAVESNTESYVGTGSTSIDVFSTESITESFNGSGNLFTASGAAEVFGANPPENTQLFSLSGVGNTREIAVYTASASGTTTLSGTAVEKNTEDYVGDNPIFTIDVFSTEKNTEAFAGTGTETLSGTLVEKNTESYVGTGVVSALSGAAEAFGANPPEDFSLFTYTGTATEKNTESYVGTGLTTIDVSHIEKNTEAFVGSGTETLSGVAVEKNTEVYIGTGSLFTTGGHAESFGANPPEDTVLFTYTGAAVEKNTESYVGVGTATASGVCVEKNTESYVGSGSISSLSGAAESFTVNPPENTHLFVSSGVAETRVIYLYRFQTDGQGTYTLSNTAAAEVSVRYWRGTGSTTASGVAIEKNTETFTGSGELFTFNGAAESRTINPDEDTLLYTFTGTATEKNTESWVGTGTETLSGTAKERNTEAYVGTGTTTASGVGVEKNTEVYIGTGSISTLSGAAEAFGVNPPENTHLFVYSGAATERNTEAYVGTGTETLSGTAVERNTESYVGTGFITALSGAAEAFSAQTPENTILFSFSSSANEAFVAQPPEDFAQLTFSGFITERNTEAHFGTGTATLSGTAVEKNTEAYNGTGTLTASGVGLNSFAWGNYNASGSLFTIAGASEAFGANPPEDTSLFTFTGFSVVLNTYKEVGTGTEFVTGTAVEKNAESYVGTGQLFNYNGAAESFTVQPTEDTVLFTFVGSASESFTSQGGETTQLFTLSGAAVEKNTEAYNGIGTETLSGVAFVISKRSYIASGSLFTSSGSAEVFGANPPENIQIFAYDGVGSEKITNVYYPEGYIYIDVDSIISETTTYTGSGSISNFSGAAEAFGANPPENIQLFTYSGAATEKNTESYVGLCDIAVDVFSVEKNTEAYDGTGTATLTGVANESNTESYVATGSLFAISGAAEAFGANPTEDTVLYTFTGAATEKNTESYNGSGSLYNVGNAAITRAVAIDSTVYVTITGDSDDARARVFVASGTATLSGAGTESYTRATYVASGTETISGAATERNTEAYNASGSLFGFGGAAEATAVVPTSNILATFSGSAGIVRTNIVIGNGTLFAFDGAAESVGRKPENETTLFTTSGEAQIIWNPWRPPRSYVTII